jgi:3',5'-cyclic AMP phosphodiesterase CpdA
VKIALVSDSHLSPRDTLLTENWHRVVNWLAATRPSLTIHLGDISANGVHAAEELVHARSVFAASGADLLYIPGNHDIGDHAAGPSHTTDDPLDPERLEQFRRIFGPDRWSIGCSEWQLIGLNAPLMAAAHPDEEEQYAWLDQTLRAGRGPLGVFLHKPLFRDHEREDIVHTRYLPQNARSRLLQALRKRDLRYVFVKWTRKREPE